MASKKFYFVINAKNWFTTGNWDKDALKSRLNSHPAVTVHDIINEDPPFLENKRAAIWAWIDESLYSQGKAYMKSKLAELANHGPVYDVDCHNLGEIEEWGETVSGTGVPIWLKAAGAVTVGAAVVVSAGILTDNLTSE